MIKIKQVFEIPIRKNEWKKLIAEINRALNDYKDRNGELVAVATTPNRIHAIIQYDV